MEIEYTEAPRATSANAREAIVPLFCFGLMVRISRSGRNFVEVFIAAAISSMFVALKVRHMQFRYFSSYIIGSRYRIQIMRLFDIYQIHQRDLGLTSFLDIDKTCPPLLELVEVPQIGE